MTELRGGKCPANVCACQNTGGRPSHACIRGITTSLGIALIANTHAFPDRRSNGGERPTVSVRQTGAGRSNGHAGNFQHSHSIQPAETVADNPSWLSEHNSDASVRRYYNIRFHGMGEAQLCKLLSHFASTAFV